MVSIDDALLWFLDVGAAVPLHRASVARGIAAIIYPLLLDNDLILGLLVQGRAAASVGSAASAGARRTPLGDITNTHDSQVGPLCSAA